MKLRVGWLSIVGKRENNEDACYVDARNRFFLVADGMGGQSAGERASALAIDIIPRKLQLIDFEKSSPEQTTKIIDDAVTQANYEIMALGELDPKLKNMTIFERLDANQQVPKASLRHFSPLEFIRFVALEKHGNDDYVCRHGCRNHVRGWRRRQSGLLAS